MAASESTVIPTSLSSLLVSLPLISPPPPPPPRLVLPPSPPASVVAGSLESVNASNSADGDQTPLEVVHYWNLVQVDDYLHNEEETELKKVVWEEMNSEYLQVLGSCLGKFAQQGKLVLEGRARFYEKPNPLKTLERSYLLKIGGKVVARPQHMLMRVSVGIHKDDIDSAIQTYNLMSQRLFTHASPTLFNAGTPRSQLRSVFRVCMKDDSIEGIYDRSNLVNIHFRCEN